MIKNYLFFSIQERGVRNKKIKKKQDEIIKRKNIYFSELQIELEILKSRRKMQRNKVCAVCAHKDGSRKRISNS